MSKIEKKSIGLPEKYLPRSLLAERRLNEIIEREDAEEIVKSMPTLDFYILTKDLGLGDALPLIKYAQPEKLKECVDIDCWAREEPDMGMAAQWTAAILETSDDKKLAETLDELDNELLTLWFQRAFTVHPLYEEPDPFVDTEKPLVTTPDRRYLLEINDEQEYGHVMASLLNAIFSLDVVFAEMLLEGVLAETPTALAEESFRFRNARLEDLGFTDYASALEIFSLINPDIKLEKEKRLAKPLEPLTEGLALVIWGGDKEDFFSKVLSLMPEGEAKDAAAASVAALANKLASVFGLSPADDERFPEALQFARDTMSLALEYRGEGDVYRAAEALETMGSSTAFRIGYSLIKKRYLSLKALFAKGFFRSESAGKLLLDEPYLEFARYLADRLPKLLIMSEDLKSLSVKNFQTLEDIKQADEIVEEFELMAAPFLEALRIKDEEIKEFAGATYFGLFATRLALWLIDEASYARPIRPLSKTECVQALELMFEREALKASLSELAQEGCEKIFLEPIRSFRPQIGAAGDRVFKRIGGSLCEHLGGIDFLRPIIAKFVKYLWIE